MGKIIFRVPESRHPFVGLGEGFIVAENSKEEPKITVKFPSHSIEITTVKGMEAKKMMAQMSSDDVWEEDKIDYAKGVVCRILKVNLINLNRSNRIPECVWGRWLIWEYCKTNLDFSYSRCGRIFNMDHSTVHAAMKKLNVRKEDNYKYMKEWEKSSYILFQREMEQYEYMFEF